MNKKDSGPDPKKIGKIFEKLFALSILDRLPWIGIPARKSSDMFLHTLEYALLDWCRRHGLSDDAAYWFGLALQVTLWVLLAGWVVKSVFEVLNDIKELWKKFRGNDDDPENPKPKDEGPAEQEDALIEEKPTDKDARGI